MIKHCIKIFLLAATFLHLPLQADIEIVVKWLPGSCGDSCVQQLDRQLHSIKDVAEIKFEGTNNQATLRWRPDRHFSFTPIDNAFRYVGVDMNEIFVTVRGTITSTHRDVTITSLGDNSKFILLSPLRTNPAEAPMPNNIQSYALKPETREQLLPTESIYQIVTAEGSLFEPERSPPNLLILEKVTIPTPWEPHQKNIRRR